jgi:hypothetical protein
MTKLHDYVDKWLTTQGFPLEFRTARALNAQGLRSLQGRYIRDPRTQQLREIDVLAGLHLEKTDVVCRVSVVVECKWSREHPWILFTGDESTSREEQVLQTIASAFGDGVLWHLTTDETFRRYTERRRPARIGFSGRQAHGEKKEKDQFYDAIQGVVGAAVAVATAEDPPPGHIVTDSPMVAHIVYPLIVVDAPLFQAFLDGDELKTEEIPHGTVLWRGHEKRDVPVPVDIVTAVSLDAYVETLGVHCREVAAYIQNPARAVSLALLTRDRSELVKRSPSFVPVPRILQGLLTGSGYYGQQTS